MTEVLFYHLETLPLERVRPPRAALDEIMDALL